MFRYICMLAALLAVVAVTSGEMLTGAAESTQYLVAFAIAMMLKPWLGSQLD